MATCIYLTHPNVDIDPAIPVASWDLSDEGITRMKAGLRQPWLLSVDHVITSSEKKAIETGRIIANHLGVECWSEAGLQENDRSSTGYLPEEEFEEVANEFFARPAVNIRGWERALDAQTRIVSAIKGALAKLPDDEAVLFAGHGGVGSLLRCHLTNTGISREYDQYAGGGCYFFFDSADLTAKRASVKATEWRRIEDLESELAG
ncbi:histidine phosphatase family protein [Pseudovibrio sp. SPO723]|uniref:histidine phosphatase family protein n=1 Tax=Nesiotobacter zosterae TaxID=392721 RepID=UPI0029C2CC66|nr:histidine phosphatase family protein [Pseudovibrio sp. SPO723]MDX5592073.1 histidine phosphatase family protein [Pseudovibrio sp. SPO723]